MEYMTRHLVAKREMQHDGYTLRPGDLFFATDVDATYLVSRGRADFAKTAQAEVMVTRPAIVLAEPVKVAEDVPAAVVEPIEATPEPEVAPRRRGRPPRSAVSSDVVTTTASWSTLADAEPQEAAD